MKKFLLATALYLCSISALHAQSKAELKIGAGIASRPFLKNIIHFSNFGAGGNDNTSYGTYHIEFLYKVLPKVKIGVAAVAEWSKNDVTGSGPDFWHKHKVYNDIDATVLGTIQALYITKPILELYSAASLGPTMRFRKILRNDFGGNEEAKKVSVAYHFTAIGLKIGKKIGGFAELGYGYKGILCGGVYMRM